MPFDSEDGVLMIRYYAGVSDLSERARAEALIARSPEERLFAKAFTSQVVHGTPEPTAEEFQSALAAWRTRATGAESATVNSRERRISLGSRSLFAQAMRRPKWYMLANAAAAILLIMVGWTAATRRFVRRLPSAMETYATANGERATITLADGSTVMLNVASRLEVPANYSAGNHTVRLTGEALFTVSHHTAAPFLVLAGPTVTRVLGTSFVVRRYGTDTATTVAVRDGKVSVGSVIVPEARFVEVGPSGVSRVYPADGSQFGFAIGVLALRGMSLAQAVPELDRWYNADIRLGDATLATKLLKGYVPAGSLADLTELLSVAFDVRVVRDGRVLTLYPR